MEFLEERISVIDYAMQLVEKGLVSRTWGNVSLRISDESMLITPSGIKYENLNPQDIVLMNIETEKFDGILKPSSEFRLHSSIYKSKKNINAIIHTHQPYASTISAIGMEIKSIFEEFAYIIGPSVKTAKYASPGTLELGLNALESLGDNFSVLLANHGAVCVGRDIEEAFIVSEVLEKSCKSFIEASFIAAVKEIDFFDAQKMRTYFLEKYSTITK